MYVFHKRQRSVQEDQAAAFSQATPNKKSVDEGLCSFHGSGRIMNDK